MRAKPRRSEQIEELIDELISHPSNIRLLNDLSDEEVLAALYAANERWLDQSQIADSGEPDNYVEDAHCALEDVTAYANKRGLLKTARRTNPLLQRPPQHHHRLGQENRLVSKGWAEPHVGVFTATDPAIAAGYALSALDIESPHKVSDIFEKKRPGYACVLTLNVTSLRIEPDVDALLWWYERGGKEAVREALKHEDYENPDDYERRYTTVDSVLLNDLQRFDFQVLGDPKVALLAREAVAGANRALGELLILGFPQQRYLNDFDLDRLVEVRTFQPIWNAVLDVVDDEKTEEDAQNIERQGFIVVTMDEVDVGTEFFNWKTLYKRSGKPCEVAYHGMTSFALESAFPSLFKGKKKLPPASTPQMEAAR